MGDAVDDPLPERLPPFGESFRPWLPKTMPRLDWTCDRYELLAMEMIAAALWAKIRVAGVDAKEFEYRVPGCDAVIRPGDVVHYARVAAGATAHRAVHVGLGLIVHVWCNTSKCTCHTMSPPGTHSKAARYAQIALTKLSDYPWAAQAWHVSRVPDSATPRVWRVYRALASIGAVNYNLLYANCDHFVDAVLDPMPSDRHRPSRIVVCTTVLVFAAVFLFLALLTTAALHASGVRRADARSDPPRSRPRLRDARPKK